MYKHIRLDNNTCFYIGKGHGNRYRYKKRNSHHDRIVENCGMRAEIIQDGLSEQEAYELERKIIEYYVFNLGYGIDIQGYRKSNGNMLTNNTFGGDGSYGYRHSEEWKKQHSIDMTGENNPMYGVNAWNLISEDKRVELREKLSQRNSGYGNPMYNVSPKQRMDEVTYKKWHETISSRCKSLIGEKNPNYKNHTLHDKLKDNPELRIEYYSRKGERNGMAKAISVYKDGKYINTFKYIGLCAEWIKETLCLNSKIHSIYGGISEAIKEDKTYRGFTFSIDK